MNNSPDGPESMFLNIASKAIETSSVVRVNLSQEMILTTEDKIRICLMEHLAKMENRGAWLAPFSTFVTILIIFVTSEFKDFFFTAATWRAVFIMGAGLSFIWLVKSLYSIGKASSMADILAAIKKTGWTQSNNDISVTTEK